jgi:hypothetical protein
MSNNVRTTGNQLDALLNKSKDLLSTTSAPRLKRGLAQIELDSENFYGQQINSSTNRDEAARRKGLILLAQKKIDTEAHEKAHELVDLKNNTVSMESYVADTDIEGHLKQYHDTVIVQALRDSMKTTNVQYERRVSRKLGEDWKAAQNELLSALGQRQGTLSNVPTNQHFQQSYGGQPQLGDRPSSLGAHRVPTTPQPQQQQSMALLGDGFSSNPPRLSPREGAYFEVVKRMNRMRVPGKNLRYPIFTQLLDAEPNHLDSEEDIQRTECWEFLQSLVGESGHATSVHGYNGPSQSAYLTKRKDCRNKPEDLVFVTLDEEGGMGRVQQNSIIERNIRYLEKSWRAACLDDDSDGIVPQDKIVTYLNSPGKRDPWGMVYCYLRCGDVTSAIALMDKIKLHQADTNIDTRYCSDDEMGAVVTALMVWKAKREGRGPAVLEEKHMKQIEEGINQARDYKKAVLIYICQINGGGRQTNTGTMPKQLKSIEKEMHVEDIMWRHLCVIFADKRTVSESREPFTLADLANLMTNHYGPDQFPNYFMVLLLCLKFEDALAHLYVIGRRMDAIHFAIALDHYGLLRRVNEGSALTRRIASGAYIDERENFQLGQMLFDYFEPHFGSELGVEMAAEYFAFLSQPSTGTSASMLGTGSMSHLSMSSGHDERNRFMSHLLVKVPERLLTKMLIGDIFDRQNSYPMEAYISDNASGGGVDRIMRMAARIADEQGAWNRAIVLHMRCKQYTRAVELVNNQLGQSIVERSSSEAKKTHLRLAADILQWLAESGTKEKVDDRKLTTLHLLLDMEEFFQLAYNQNYDQALQTNTAVLFPISGDDVERSAKRQKFNQLEEPVTKNLDVLLVSYMGCLVKSYEDAVQKVQGGGGGWGTTTTRAYNDKRDETMRRAKALMNFANHELPQQFRLKRETHEELTNLDMRIQYG